MQMVPDTMGSTHAGGAWYDGLDICRWCLIRWARHMQVVPGTMGLTHAGGSWYDWLDTSILAVGIQAFFQDIVNKVKSFFELKIVIGVASNDYRYRFEAVYGRTENCSTARRPRLQTKKKSKYLSIQRLYGQLDL